MAPLSAHDLTTPVRLSVDNFTHQLWGGTWIRQFKGLPASSELVGESWEASALPTHPSFVTRPNGERMTLADLIARNPGDILGNAVVARFGSTLPVLIKLIDAQDDLSMQVHPPDRPEAPGKSEAWVVLETNPSECFIYLGFSPEKADGYPTREAFQEAFFGAINQANGYGPSDDATVREKAARLVLPFLNKIKTAPGDIFEIRPGVVHALGKGVRLYEIQQASDVTYRIWDWNRPDRKTSADGRPRFRDLHLTQAKDVIDFSPMAVDELRGGPSLKSGTERLLFTEQTKKFEVSRLVLTEKDSELRLKSPSTFQILTVVKGRVFVDGFPEPFGPGSSCFVPACVPETRLRAATAVAEVLRGYVPI